MLLVHVFLTEKVLKEQTFVSKHAVVLFWLDIKPISSSNTAFHLLLGVKLAYKNFQEIRLWED